MKAMLIGAGALAMLSAAPAIAADIPVKAPMPAPVGKGPVGTAGFDVAIGGVVMSDYNFRGISQSNKGPTGGAYFEGQYNTGAYGTWYLGIAGYGINWPSGSGYGFTDPSAEIDFYGGWRNTYGKASVDIGLIYYYYPKEIFNGFTSDSDFLEVYWKGSYAVNDVFTVGANVYWTPDLLNYSTSFSSVGFSNKPDALYASVTAKYVLPWTSGSWGSYVSGELGHWWIDDTGFKATNFPFTDPSYTYWNAGLALTYKAITLDFRYHGTSQSVQECAQFLWVAIPNGSNNWCGDRFIASLKFDTTLSALK
jgi:uncharacterized protein (TIGR02001 family)